jgi:hypothetical protein
MCAFWLGGASAPQSGVIEPPMPPEIVGGGGMGWRRSLDLETRKKQDDEEIAILVPEIWTTIHG